MNWWKESTIPFDRKEFMMIINGFVFQCPTCIKSGKKNKRKYTPVSARKNTFRNRGIDKGLLKTLFAKIRNSIEHPETFCVIENSESVEDKVKSITGFADSDFELVVFCKRTDTSQPESFYYYIRNAFAHGSFEIINGKKEPIYLLECKKGEKINARMRLKESTLLKFVELGKIKKSELCKLQTKKAGKKNH